MTTYSEEKNDRFARKQAEYEARIANMPREANPEDRTGRTPEDKTVAERHRREDLQHAIDNSRDSMQVGHAKRELQYINTQGYSWPAHSGSWVVGKPVYDDAQQKARVAAETDPAA